MPFDSLPENGLHNLVRLRDHLRAPLPTAFEWDYGYVMRHKRCGSAGCALGLALVTMPDFRARFSARQSFDGAPYFGISVTEFQFVFLYVPLGQRVEDVTPAEVARRIDEVLRVRSLMARAQEPEVKASGVRRLGGPALAERVEELV